MAERPFDFDREERAHAISRIQAHFASERDEPLGDLGATMLFDFITEELGPLFYNRGLDDARALLARATDSLDGGRLSAPRSPATMQT